MEELTGSCKLQFLVETRLRYKDIRYQHNRVNKMLPILFGENHWSMSEIHITHQQVTEVVNVANFIRKKNKKFAEIHKCQGT